MPPRKLDLGNLVRGDRVETIEFAGDLRITLRVQETAVLGSASSCINKGVRMIPRDRIRVKKGYPLVTGEGYYRQVSHGGWRGIIGTSMVTS